MLMFQCDIEEKTLSPRQEFQRHQHDFMIPDADWFFTQILDRELLLHFLTLYHGT